MAAAGSSSHVQPPAAVAAPAAAQQDTGSVRSTLATLGEEGPSLGALRAFRPPRGLSTAESAYGQAEGTPPLVAALHWSSGVVAAAGPSLDMFDEGEEGEDQQMREGGGEGDQHSMYVSPLDTAFEVVLPATQELSGAGTAYQVRGAACQSAGQATTVTLYKHHCTTSCLVPIRNHGYWRGLCSRLCICRPCDHMTGRFADLLTGSLPGAWRVQVEAEGKAISWLLELGAGGLPDGLQALVQVRVAHQCCCQQRMTTGASNHQYRCQQQLSSTAS
jgi:hypothetical protein